MDLTIRDLAIFQRSKNAHQNIIIDTVSTAIVVCQSITMYPFWSARAPLLAFCATAASRRSFTASTTTTLQAAAAAAAAAGVPPPPQKQYILRYDYVPNVLELRGPYRDEHLQLAQTLCLSGGPTALLDETMTTAAPVPTGALFLFANASSAQTFVKQDPYVTAGIVTRHTIEEWTVVIQN